MLFPTLGPSLMLFPTLGPSSLPVVVAQPDERHANRIASVLAWYDRHKAIVQHLVQTKKSCNNAIVSDGCLKSYEFGRICIRAQI